MKAEIGVMETQDEEYQGFLATTRSWEEAKKDSSLEHLEGA